MKRREKNMKIVRMKQGEWGKVKAFFDLETEDGFTIKGFKLVEGITGLFVGFPSQKNSAGEYYDTVWADKEQKEELLVSAKREYDNPSERQQDLEPVSEEELPF